MSYSFESRIRFSESGEDGRLSLPALLDYYQDCVVFQAGEIHQSREERAARNRVWVLSSWQIQIKRYPKTGEKIRTTTFPYEWKAFMGLRNFLMETEEGERLSWANSYWTNLNLETGRPERLTMEDKEGYDMGEKISMEYAPRKIDLPEGGVEEEPFEVQKFHLDANHHVNNGQYVRMAMQYLPEQFEISQLRVEYLQQGRLGDVFHPMVWRSEDSVIVSFMNEEKKPYAVVEFT